MVLPPTRSRSLCAGHGACARSGSGRVCIGCESARGPQRYSCATRGRIASVKAHCSSASGRRVRRPLSQPAHGARSCTAAPLITPRPTAPHVDAPACADGASRAVGAAGNACLRRLGPIGRTGCTRLLCRSERQRAQSVGCALQRHRRSLHAHARRTAHRNGRSQGSHAHKPRRASAASDGAMPRLCELRPRRQQCASVVSS
jgi:hypothetical protein